MRESEQSVLGGQLIRSSVSAMTAFSAELGGCPRRWWYRYVARLPKEEDSGAALYGKEAHKELEDYWNSDRSGRVSDRIGAVVQLLGSKQLGQAELGIRSLTLAGIPFKGSIDYALGPYIYDYKFQSKFRALPFGPQAIGYLEERRLTQPSIQVHSFNYIHVLSTAPYSARFGKETLTLTAPQIAAKWKEYEPLMEEMKLAASQDEEEVWCNTKACYAYGRQCPYFSACNKGVAKQSSVLRKELTNMSFLGEILAAKAEPELRALPPDAPPADTVPINVPEELPKKTLAGKSKKTQLKAIRVGLKIGMPEYSSVEASVEVEGTDEELMAEEAKAALGSKVPA